MFHLVMNLSTCNIRACAILVTTKANTKGSPFANLPPTHYLNKSIENIKFNSGLTASLTALSYILFLKVCFIGFLYSISMYCLCCCRTLSYHILPAHKLSPLVYHRYTNPPQYEF